jgi:hypothetical protein
LVVCYNGPSEEGERLVKPLRTFGSVLMDGLGPMPYTTAQKLVDDFYPKGLQNYWKPSFLKEISADSRDSFRRG